MIEKYKLESETRYYMFEAMKIVRNHKLARKVNVRTLYHISEYLKLNKKPLISDITKIIEDNYKS